MEYALSHAIHSIHNSKPEETWDEETQSDQNNSLLMQNIFSSSDRIDEFKDFVQKSMNENVNKFREEIGAAKIDYQFEVDFEELHCLRRKERAAKIIEDRKIRESKRHSVQFEMQLAGPNDDISEILSRNLF